MKGIWHYSVLFIFFFLFMCPWGYGEIGGEHECTGFPGVEVTGSCEPPGGHWELNLSPLEEQQELLITEPSPQFMSMYYYYYYYSADWGKGKETGGR